MVAYGKKGRKRIHTKGYPESRGGKKYIIKGPFFDNKPYVNKATNTYIEKPYLGSHKVIDPHTGDVWYTNDPNDLYKRLKEKQRPGGSETFEEEMKLRKRWGKNWYRHTEDYTFNKAIKDGKIELVPFKNRQPR